MEHLLHGVHQFHSQVFSEEKEFFETLVHGQSPSALVISCSDSRVDPNLILQANPGDLFSIRNAGNMVPAFGASNGGEGASLEYAVAVLGVKHIVVCGHSHCGAVKALLDPSQTEKLPVVRQWLTHAEATRRIVTENYSGLSGDLLVEVAVQENVLVQVENLQTHPAVAARLQRGELELHAWIHELETGEIRAFSSESETFEILRHRAAAAPFAAKRTPGSVRRAGKPLA